MTHREIIARALCVADERAPDPDAPIYINMRAAKAWEARLPDADRFLADLDKRGLCIVPKEPSFAMLRAADERRGTGHPHEDIYRAMISAAPK